MNNEVLYQEFVSLPEGLKKEVKDFIDFLKLKYSVKEGKSANKERVFGISKGKYTLSNDFDEPLDDFKDYMS